MTDKLKCPFCGAELRIDNIGFYACPTVHCAIWECDGVPQEIIKALFSGKKAQDALNYAIGVLDNLTEIGGVDMEIIKIKKMAGITKQGE